MGSHGAGILGPFGLSPLPRPVGEPLAAQADTETPGQDSGYGAEQPSPHTPRLARLACGRATRSPDPPAAGATGGIVRQRALAILRLITNSNLVGCSTGRSPALAPLRILST